MSFFKRAAVFLTAPWPLPPFSGIWFSAPSSSSFSSPSEVISWTDGMSLRNFPGAEFDGRFFERDCDRRSELVLNPFDTKSALLPAKWKALHLQRFPPCPMLHWDLQYRCKLNRFSPDTEFTRTNTKNNMKVILVEVKTAELNIYIFSWRLLTCEGEIKLGCADRWMLVEMYGGVRSVHCCPLTDVPSQ